MCHYTAILALLLLSCGTEGIPEGKQSRHLKVGIYQNSPKVFCDETGTPRGLFIDIIEAIAAAEGWRLEYAPGTWKENLERLTEGRLDLVLDVSHSEERARRFTLNEIPVIESWLQAYTRTNARLITSLADLDGLRIAVLEGSIQETEFREEIPRTHAIQYSLKTYPEYRGTIAALENGEADVLIANRFFYFSPERGSRIRPEPLVLRPAGVFFAFAKGRHAELAARLDARLVALKNDPESAYYRALQYWLHEIPRPTLPWYTKGIFTGMLGALGLALLFLLLLRRQVRIRTVDLRARNIELGLANERLEKLVGKLVTAERRIQGSLEEKETLLKELYHRVKNNMQVIASLLNLQAGQPEYGAVAPAFRDAVNRIHSMALVHEKLYQSRDLSRIDLGEYIHDLAQHLRQSIIPDPERLELSVEIPPIRLLIDAAIPLGIVLNELLVNSLKHAFPEGRAGRISITLHTIADGMLELDYHDNGPGLMTDEPNETPPGALGIPLIRNIVENQLHGTISFRNENGLACRIRFGPTEYDERV